MMLRRFCSICAVLCAAVVFPAAVEAQVTLGIGRALTSGDFADEARDGWSAQGTYGFAVPGLPVRLRADLVYQNFRNVARAPSLYARQGGEWFRQMGAVLNATHALELGAVRPYGIAGVGLLREWHDDTSYSGTDHVNLTVNAGVGLEVPLSAGGRGLFVEARLVNFIGGKALPLTRPAVLPEVKFQSIPVLIGIRL